MARLEVMNPVALSAQFKVSPAKRLDALAGRTIGLYWNMKSGGDVALAHISDLLKHNYPDLQFKNYIGAVGAGMRHATSDQLDRMEQECSAVIGTTAD